jgi:hypothetical protein
MTSETLAAFSFSVDGSIVDVIKQQVIGSTQTISVSKEIFISTSQSVTIYIKTLVVK